MIVIIVVVIIVVIIVTKSRSEVEFYPEPWSFYRTNFPGLFVVFRSQFELSLQEMSMLCLSVCLNHTVIHKYLINTKLYLTFSKYDDKLLVVKSLINILKSTYINIAFYSLFCRYLWSKK